MDVCNYLTLDVEFEVAYKSKTNTQTKPQLMTKISYEKKNILATSHLSIGQLKNHLLHEGFLYQPSKVQSPSQKFSLNLACFTPFFFFPHLPLYHSYLCECISGSLPSYSFLEGTVQPLFSSIFQDMFHGQQAFYIGRRERKKKERLVKYYLFSFKSQVETEMS